MSGSFEMIVVDAFEEGPFTGNPAAVVPLDAPFDSETMAKIAGQMNLSETAFVVGDGASRSLRWFTPRVEVDLCGHATLAAAHVAFRDPALSRVEFETRSGRLAATRESDGIEIELPADSATERGLPASLIDAIGVSSVEATLAGRTDVVVVVTSEADLRSISPDLGAIARHDFRGVIVTSAAESGEVDFVSRFFAPACGVPEDPVTGSAHTTIAPYWADRLDRGDTLVARQLSERGGRLRCRVVRDASGAPERVALRGSTRTVIEGRFFPSSSLEGKSPAQKT